MAIEEDYYKACNQGDLEAVKAILASGVDVNARTAKHLVPALAAITSGRDEIVSLLLGEGLVVTDQMIQAAVIKKRAGIAEQLILSPNEKQLRKTWVRDTRAMAKERGMPEIAKLIGERLS